jgi:GDPmannose 4,6-dehydratase
MKKALITGAQGQDGSYLSEYLLSLGYQVFGLVRANSEVKESTRHLLGKVTYLYGDVRDELSLRTAILKVWPDEIYNLAGQVFVPISWQQSAETFDVNTGGLARLLKIVEEIKKEDTRIYQACTSEMFGNHEGACTEKSPMNPTSPYGISKLAAHKLAALYRERGLYVVSGILFNHESPRRGQEMVTRKIVMAVAGWAKGDTTPLSLGYLDSRRDWGYAGEYVKVMQLMLQQEHPQDYVYGTGESHSVREFLCAACHAAKLPMFYWQDLVKIDERFLRVQEIHDMRADNSKVTGWLGWKREVNFDELVSMMVEAEMEKVKVAVA